MAFGSLFLLISLALVVQGQDESIRNDTTVIVSKCCEINSLLVEANLGQRICKKRSELLHIDLQLARTKWEPAFFKNGVEVIGPKTVVLQIGKVIFSFKNSVVV